MKSSSTLPAVAPRRAYQNQLHSIVKNFNDSIDVDEDLGAQSSAVMHKSNRTSMDDGEENVKASQSDILMLTVILPSGDTCPFNVNKRMPLMDVLVHVAATHHFNPSDYAVYNPNAKFPSSLTPSTAIGELNTAVVHIIPKDSPQMNTLTKHKPLIKLAGVASNGEEPFEKTFRLQINLPHKQKMVLRVNPKRILQDVLSDICREKSLNADDYTLRNPRHPDQPLDMYRQLAEERINEINLVPSFQDTIERRIGKNSPLADRMMEVPSGVQYEKKRSPLDILLCRKKRLVTKEYTDSNMAPPKSSLYSTKRFSQSVSSLAEISPLTIERSKASKKGPAPRPPQDQPTAALSNHHAQPPYPTTNTSPPHERARHHSESSGYDESVMLSNSPEREGGSVTDETGGRGHFTSPSPVIHDDVKIEEKKTQSTKVPVAIRSSTSTPDSGLKSASEMVSKTGGQVMKKKAPAPPPPVAVSVSVKEPLRAQHSIEDVGASEVRSRTASDVSSVSLSISTRSGTESIKVDVVNPSSRKTSSSDISGRSSNETFDTVVKASDKRNDQVSLGDDAASFTYEAEQHFDDESTDGSVEIPMETRPNVHHQESLTQHRSSVEAKPQDSGYEQHKDSPLQQRSITGSAGSSGSTGWMETSVVDVNKDSIASDAAVSGVTNAKLVHPGAESPIESSFERSDLRALSSQTTAEILPSRGSTPDSGIQSQRASLKETTSAKSPPVNTNQNSFPTKTSADSQSNSHSPVNATVFPSDSPSYTLVPSGKETLPTAKTDATAVPSVLPKLNIPPQQQQKSRSPPSPTPSKASSTASSASNAPLMPDTTPPPVVTKPSNFYPRSPAHVSISSFNDQKPSRYRDIVALQPPMQYDPIMQSNQISEDVSALLQRNQIASPNDDLFNQSQKHFPRHPEVTAAVTSRRNSFLARSPSRDELVDEIKIVQQTITELNSQMSAVELHSGITPEELASIKEKQRLLQDHVQRQIVLTQKLLEQDQNTVEKPGVSFKRPVSPPPVKTIRQSSPSTKNFGGVSYSEVIGLPKKQMVAPQLSGDGKSLVYATIVADDADRRAGNRGMSDGGKQESRMRMGQRNSWMLEASKRIDLSGSSNASKQSTPPPTPETPEPASTSHITISTGMSSNQPEMKPTFSFSTNRKGQSSINPSRSFDNSTGEIPPPTKSTKSASSSDFSRFSSAYRQPSAKMSTTRVTSSATTNRSSIHETGITSGPLRSIQNSYRVTTNDEKEETGGNAPPVDIDSIVRSWKNGTPTPYHHINPHRPSGVFKNEAKDENKVPLPPPPPPKSFDVTRSISTPVSRAEKATAVERSGSDIKSELMDEIKNFSVDSLRKVPAGNQKTWTPKIR